MADDITLEGLDRKFSSLVALTVVGHPSHLAAKISQGFILMGVHIL